MQNFRIILAGLNGKRMDRGIGICSLVLDASKRMVVIPFFKQGRLGKIMIKKWFWGPAMLTLRKWDPCFDPRTTYIHAHSGWVKLLGLPLEF